MKRPSWKKAPEWANYLGSTCFGSTWTWFENKPSYSLEFGAYWKPSYSIHATKKERELLDKTNRMEEAKCTLKCNKPEEGHFIEQRIKEKVRIVILK
jgi:hypothetical protein